MTDLADHIAPPGTIWVCGACGKTARSIYGDDPSDPLGWDESCMLNANRCIESSLVRDEHGQLTAADLDPNWEPPKRKSFEEMNADFDKLMAEMADPNWKPDPELLELARQSVGGGEIPLCYPKIPRLKKLRAKQVEMKGPAVAFEKYDGTNLHWVIKGGQVVEFGARRTRFEFTDRGIELFHEHHKGTLKYPLDLIRACPLPEYDAILFTEYLGAGSFNGQHDPEADPSSFRLVLIDIERDGTILSPYHFQPHAAELGWPDVAKEVWRGQLTSGRLGRFMADVHTGAIEVVEGVVIKGPGYAFKVKTDAWEKALRESKG